VKVLCCVLYWCGGSDRSNAQTALEIGSDDDTFVLKFVSQKLLNIIHFYTKSVLLTEGQVSHYRNNKNGMLQ
jgi:hypothetical protein